MCGCRDKIRVADRAGMLASHNQPSNMRNIRQQQRTCFPRNSSHARKVDDPRISAGSHRDHLRSMFLCQTGQLIVIDQLAVFAHSIMDHFKEPTGKIDLVAMSQMPAMSQVHR